MTTRQKRADCSSTRRSGRAAPALSEAEGSRPFSPPTFARHFLVGALVGGVVVWAVLSLSWGSLVAVPKPRLDPLATPPQDYDWTDQPEPAFPIPPYARFLAGVKIVLDPGHVGQRDPGGTWKRGPTGLREAEVNSRVAQFLREFLASAGAQVVLTREVDESLDLPDTEDLRQRAQLADRERADLLVSIHHNGSDDPQPNHTSLFYHRSPDHTRASLCAARHLLTGLNDALRLETHLECAVLSDRLLHKNGLAVLREARVPAVLSEASFHSNPAEERRLRDPVYNRREAYGLFLGLARWAQAGLPRVRLTQPREGRVRAGGVVVVALDDGLSSRGGWGSDLLKVLPDSVVVKLNGRPVRHTLDLRRGQVRVTMPAGLGGKRCALFVDFENVFGQHVLHPQIELEISGR